MKVGFADEVKKWSRVHFKAYVLCSLSSIATIINGFSEDEAMKVNSASLCSLWQRRGNILFSNISVKVKNYSISESQNYQNITCQSTIVALQSHLICYINSMQLRKLWVGNHKKNWRVKHSLIIKGVGAVTSIFSGVGFELWWIIVLVSPLLGLLLTHLILRFPCQLRFLIISTTSHQ